MCGICGYVGTHRPELLEPMCTALAHRGPDDWGTWHDGPAQVGLGHRRLSIIDVSPAGHQPMSSPDGTVWITYNGEVYNFPEHRARLLAAGRTFRGRSDTEVLVHLYHEKGPQFLADLNGMFALAIWDSRRGQLLLARDHAGVKPLYYWQDGPRLYFASEIKALLRIPELPRVLNREAIPHYLTLLWVPGPETMLRDIRKLEPGHRLIWKSGHVDVAPWFTLDYTADESVPESQWVERVHDTFMRTTERQMVSDVPLGAFLSGGTDSSAIVTCMRKCFPHREIKCYTYTFPSGDMARDQMEPDYPYARWVADLMGVDLHSFELRPDVVSLLPKMVHCVEEPDADPTVFPSYLISQAARADGTTVLLSGMGGDEVFFGYRSYLALRFLERLKLLPRWLLAPGLRGAAAITALLMGAQSAVPRRLARFARAVTADGIRRHLAFSDWSSPAVRHRLYTPEFANTLPELDSPPECLARYSAAFRGQGAMNHRSHLLIQTFLGAHNFLYTDKSSMAVSLEVRVPFMDLELMRLCAAIPERLKLKGRVTKHLLKEALKPYLPADVLHRSKTGFGPPLRKWIAVDLDPVIRELLSPASLAARGFFSPSAVQTIIEANRANRADHAYLIYALLTFELWLRTFIDRPGVECPL